jgi:hypothetical protein
MSDDLKFQLRMTLSDEFAQVQIRMFDARSPDLLTVDHIMVTVADRRGPRAQRVSARGGLGDTESLQPDLA